MNNLNSILLEGELLSDPELAYSQKGAPVCRFKIECRRFFKNVDEEMQNDSSTFAIHTWNRLAEVCNEHLRKGRGVRVVGRLKAEGPTIENYYKDQVYIIAEHVEFKPVYKAKSA